MTVKVWMLVTCVWSTHLSHWAWSSVSDTTLVLLTTTVVIGTMVGSQHSDHHISFPLLWGSLWLLIFANSNFQLFQLFILGPVFIWLPLYAHILFSHVTHFMVISVSGPCNSASNLLNREELQMFLSIAFRVLFVSDYAYILHTLQQLLLKSLFCILKCLLPYGVVILLISTKRKFWLLFFI